MANGRAPSWLVWTIILAPGLLIIAYVILARTVLAPEDPAPVEDQSLNGRAVPQWAHAVAGEVTQPCANERACLAYKGRDGTQA